MDKAWLPKKSDCKGVNRANDTKGDVQGCASFRCLHHGKGYLVADETVQAARADRMPHSKRADMQDILSYRSRKASRKRGFWNRG